MEWSSGNKTQLNTKRNLCPLGAIIDQATMTEMLTEGRFRAGLDVYEAPVWRDVGRLVEGEHWDAWNRTISDVRSHEINEIILTILIGNEYQ